MDERPEVNDIADDDDDEHDILGKLHRELAFSLIMREMNFSGLEYALPAWKTERRARNASKSSPSADEESDFRDFLRRRGLEFTEMQYQALVEKATAGKAAAMPRVDALSGTPQASAGITREQWRRQVEERMKELSDSEAADVQILADRWQQIRSGTLSDVGLAAALAELSRAQFRRAEHRLYYGPVLEENIPPGQEKGPLSYSHTPLGISTRTESGQESLLRWQMFSGASHTAHYTLAWAAHLLRQGTLTLQQWPLTPAETAAYALLTVTLREVPLTGAANFAAWELVRTEPESRTEALETMLRDGLLQFAGILLSSVQQASANVEWYLQALRKYVTDETNPIIAWGAALSPQADDAARLDALLDLRARWLTDSAEGFAGSGMTRFVPVEILALMAARSRFDWETPLPDHFILEESCGRLPPGFPEPGNYFPAALPEILHRRGYVNPSQPR